MAMARRLCVFAQVAAGKKISVSPPSRRGFQCAPQRLMLSSKSSFSSSCISACSISATSESSVGFPRPAEIPWQKGLVNSVNLIGRINESINITYLDSGKIVATTYIRVHRIQGTGHSVFRLQFWDELAEIAAAHLKKEDLVYVEGSVWIESYSNSESVSMSICKVVARDLKFVAGYQTLNGDNNKAETDYKETRNTEDLWRNLFQTPLDFWDNRLSKKNSDGPDFKHKSTGAPLWLSGRDTPSWVHERIGQLPSKDEKLKQVEKLWRVFFADPLEWWDNRNSKKSPTYPDFRNKSSGEALWINSLTTPSWVKSQLELLDSKMRPLKEGGAISESASASKGRTPKTSFEDEDLMFF